MLAYKSCRIQVKTILQNEAREDVGLAGLCRYEDTYTVYVGVGVGVRQPRDLLFCPPRLRYFAPPDLNMDCPQKPSQSRVCTNFKPVHRQHFLRYPKALTLTNPNPYLKPNSDLKNPNLNQHKP